MKKEVVIIGVGKFSLSLINKLKNVPKYKIVVIDKDREKLEGLTGIKSLIIGDATNEDFIKNLGIENASFYVIGTDSNFENTILIASILKGLFNGVVISKATTRNHEIILRKLGVKDIVSPEISAGKRTFNKIVNPFAIKGKEKWEITEMTEGISMATMPITHNLHNVKVIDAKFPKGIVLVLIYKNNKPTIVSGDTILEEGDDISIISEDRILIKFLEESHKEFNDQN